jgi:aspartyl-tRNA(Asn)/glutamyl-tRNA(Gln) amidotransferase subunit C
MKNNPIDVPHIATLANLPLTQEEKEKFEPQLASILDYIEKLKEIDTSTTSETSQVTGLENVEREDATAPSLTKEEALANTKAVEKGMFKVPAIMEQEQAS